MSKRKTSTTTRKVVTKKATEKKTGGSACRVADSKKTTKPHAKRSIGTGPRDKHK